MGSQAPEPEASTQPPDADDVDGIIAEARTAIRSGTSAVRGFPYPPTSPTIWVKYGRDYDTMWLEAATQDYVHKHLQSLPSSERKSIHVPEVFRVIEIDNPRTVICAPGCSPGTYGLIVMELVSGTAISQIVLDRGFDESGQYIDRAFEGVNAILATKPMPEVAPGPGNDGGGRINHFIFGQEEFQAPEYFDSLKELENWVNEENSKTDPDLEKADFMAEGLRLCYCDLNLDNFLLQDSSEPSSTLYIIDFEHASWLPVSFLLWEVYNKKLTLGDREHLIVENLESEPPSRNRIALDRLGIARYKKQYPIMGWALR